MKKILFILALTLTTGATVLASTATSYLKDGTPVTAVKNDTTGAITVTSGGQSFTGNLVNGVVTLNLAPGTIMSFPSGTAGNVVIITNGVSTTVGTIAANGSSNINTTSLTTALATAETYAATQPAAGSTDGGTVAAGGTETGGGTGSGAASLIFSGAPSASTSIGGTISSVTSAALTSPTVVPYSYGN